MDINSFSPFIRLASKDETIKYTHPVLRRVILDYEIVCVEDGACRMTYEDREYLVQKGDILFIRPGIPHSFEPLDEMDFVQPHIHFDINYDIYSNDVYICFKSEEELTDFDKIIMRKDIFADFTQESPIITIRNMEAFREVFYRIIEIHHYKPPLHQITCKAKMIELLAMIIRDNFPAFIEKGSGSTELDIYAVKNYIDANLKELLTLEQLSEHFNYNKFYLLRLFKTTFHVSPIHYYNNLRMDEAKRLLSTYSVTEVAEILRFSSIHAFSRAFKATFDISPVQWKRRNKRGK